MVVVNFAHPLEPDQLAAIEASTGEPVERVIGVPVHLDPDRPFEPQALAVVAEAGLSAAEWQTTLLLVNLPGHSAIAALVLAELNGRMGYFPSVLRMRTVGGEPPRWELAEILGLQRVRDEARRRREGGK